jgi:DNA-binding transcriptional ArsR family regulator
MTKSADSSAVILEVLGDPARRRILELLATGEQSAGRIGEALEADFSLSQPAVSRHLKILKEAGLATVRAEGTSRVYALEAAPLQALDAWLDHFRGFWERRLDALETEIARGKRDRLRHRK